MSSRLAVHTWDAPEAEATLVLLHGITDSGLCWADAVNRWHPTYRVIALDALGHGESDRFRPDELAADPIEPMLAETIAVLEQLGSLVILVGHSMGGAVAAAITHRRPDLVTALVLEDPAWRDLTPDQQRQRGQDFLGGRGAPGENWPASEIEPWRRSYDQTDRAFLSLGRATPSDPWREIVGHLTVPTLLVTGTDGVILAEERLAEIRGIGNPHVEIAVIPGAGHCVRRDRTDAFHATVDPWIRRHRVAP
ncbi:alpha/beta fold hydrolase [Ruania alba]|uniref:Lysophospholipase, alpha-beta hydrolase superfamily n=1 Tax=Ruania alba TaxID=648782 RepID=A0A1H5MZ59_9MICO|nr:alpha/beta hydrolase [Ruania alba]SEE94546.1 Lysophospholipase, alpha-beta hydrolase superfamily [Ruania alba]